MQPALTKFLLAITLSAGVTAPAFASADIGGIALGMKAEDAMKVIKNSIQGANGQLSKVNFTLTFDRAQNKSGAFEIYTAIWRDAKSGGVIVFGVSPLTGNVWSVTKQENPQSARPTLQAIADAANKYGKVNTGALTNTEYIQRWMYNAKGTELEWSNSYDKPQNGNCFASLQAAKVNGADLWFPSQPTTACTTVYWVNSKSSSANGMATTYTSVAIDIAAYREWYQSVDVKAQKALEQQKSGAPKPQL